MSYICVNCEKAVILDVAATNAPEGTDIPESQAPNPSQQEFLQLRDELIQEFKEFLPNFHKYKPETHTICESCLHNIMKDIEKDINLEESKINSMAQDNKRLDEDIKKTEQKLEHGKINEAVESKLRQDLNSVIAKEQEQKNELEELGKLQISCETTEQTYWEETLTFESKLFLLNERKNSVNRQIKEIQNEIDRLNRINILNDIIHITADHEVAKVNDLQLGKKFNAGTVNWGETNAALGQLVLLFAILEFKCPGMKYEKIRLKPQGSFSEVIRFTHDREERYELVGPPKDELRFNFGLFTLLEAMTQIHHYLSSKLAQQIQGGPYDFQHKIIGENIGGLPFRYHSSKLDKWTEVLKYFAINCKNLIYYFSLYQINRQKNLE